MTDDTEILEEVSLNEPAVVTVVGQEEVVQILQPPEQPSSSSGNVHTEPPKKISTISVPNPDQAASPAKVEAQTMCFLCENNRFNDQNSRPHDQRFIQPCFCGFRVHHGCLSELLYERKQCHLCGVKYRYYKYGTCCDFVRYYSCRFTCLAFFCIIMWGIAGYLFYQSIPMKTGFRVFLSFVGSICLFTGFGVLGVCLRKAFTSLMPRFKTRHGNLTIFEYQPFDGKKYKKPKRSDFKALYGKSDNIVTLDVTAGQYLLGHEKNFSKNQASTPLVANQEPVRFSFDTPDALTRE